ncbi:MAG: hypothetical protein H7A24_11550 [Leptospiraceae bacterium]|nr:hypothetical protein [Leptospiraceae bacterium]MCP5512507.1 hypothetical protein [Leptospiraceae bacterium]
MKLFSKEYRIQLNRMIGEIEKVSGVEVVIVVGKKSANYLYIHLISGVLLSFAFNCYQMFIDIEIADEVIFVSTVLSFVVGYLLMYIPGLSSLLIPKEILRRNAEIYARALFQKGKIYETNTRQGILLYVSLFEKTIMMIEDKNVASRIPFHVIQAQKKEFDSLFQGIWNLKFPEEFLNSLNRFKATAEKYIPVSKNDVNEIPDDLEIIL